MRMPSPPLPPFLCLMAALLPALALAQGGPPLLTDDPGTPGDGHSEINVAVTATHRPDERRVEAPLVDMNFGITERGQFKIEAPLAIDRQSGSGARAGLGDVTLGWKWRFLDQGKASPVDVSVYPQVSFSPSSRSTAQGLAEPGTRWLLPIEVAHSFGRLSVDGEIGRAFRTQDPDVTLYGVAMGWKANAHLEWLAEYHRTISRDPGERERIVDVGLRRELRPHLTLLAAVGASPGGPASERTRLNAYVGLQFTR